MTDTREPRLSFVIAGAQKGGTSTLDEIFRAHPQIQMASRKEVHFFDDEQHDWSTPDYGALDAFFPAIDDRIRGEATPITLYWRPAIPRLRAYNPDIRIILLLRNPVERAFSNWRKEYSIQQDAASFEEAIRRGRNRVQQQAEIEDLHRVFSYVERGFYGRQLAYLLDHFPRQQVHCEVSEEFFRDQQATLRRLCAFLGVDPFPGGLAPVHMNPGRVYDYPSRLSPESFAYLSALYRDDVRAVESLLRRPIPDWHRPLHELASAEDANWS